MKNTDPIKNVINNVHTAPEIGAKTHNLIEMHNVPNQFMKINNPSFNNQSSYKRANHRAGKNAENHT